MKLKLINPNTTAKMTMAIAAGARKAASPGVEVEAVTARDGPPAIEGRYDEAFAATATVENVREDDGKADAFIVACFGEPGLLAAREATVKPVVGIAHAAMCVATMVAERFAIVTTLARTIPISSRLVHAYGMEKFCAPIRAAEVPVLALEQDAEQAYRAIENEGRQAVAHDDIGAVILGCAGMSAMTDRLAGVLGVPVLDGVACAVRLCEALVGLRLSTSKKSYPQPLGKDFIGKFAAMSPPR